MYFALPCRLAYGSTPAALCRPAPPRLPLPPPAPSPQTSLKLLVHTTCGSQNARLFKAEQVSRKGKGGLSNAMTLLRPGKADVPDLAGPPCLARPDQASHAGAGRAAGPAALPCPDPPAPAAGAAAPAGRPPARGGCQSWSGRWRPRSGSPPHRTPCKCNPFMLPCSRNLPWQSLPSFGHDGVDGQKLLPGCNLPSATLCDACTPHPSLHTGGISTHTFRIARTNHKLVTGCTVKYFFTGATAAAG